MGSVLTTISRFLTRGTSAAAHTDIIPKKQSLRDRCIEVLACFGPLTADEVAARLGVSVLSIRPRMTELADDLRIIATGDRRPNASGKQAIVWSKANDLSRLGRGNYYTQQFQAKG